MSIAAEVWHENRRRTVCCLLLINYCHVELLVKRTVYCSVSTRRTTTQWTTLNNMHTTRSPHLGVEDNEKVCLSHIISRLRAMSQLASYTRLDAFFGIERSNEADDRMRASWCMRMRDEWKERLPHSIDCFRIPQAQLGIYIYIYIFKLGYA